MLNFQVHSLGETIKHLERIGVAFAKKKVISEFGKFIWIKDPEGRLIEHRENSELESLAIRLT